MKWNGANEIILCGELDDRDVFSIFIVNQVYGLKKTMVCMDSIVIFMIIIVISVIIESFSIFILVFHESFLSARK